MFKEVGKYKHKVIKNTVEEKDKYKIVYFLEDGYYYVEGHIGFRFFKTVPMHSEKYALNIFQDYINKAQGNHMHGRKDIPKVGPLRGV